MISPTVRAVIPSFPDTAVPAQTLPKAQQIPLKNYLRGIDFLDAQNNVDPERLPKNAPPLQEDQIKEMDDIFEDLVPIISSNGRLLCELSLKNVVDIVRMILKAHPEYGELVDVIVVGGKVSQILNLSKNGEVHLKELNLPGFDPKIHCCSSQRYLRQVPDVDVRFVFKGCNAANRLNIKDKLEDELVNIIRKQNPGIIIEDAQVKRLIKNTFYTKFSNPEEALDPDNPLVGNRFLVLSMGNRKNYGMEVVLADNLIRQEVYSQELKLSYLNKCFYLHMPEEVAWVWQGLIDRLTGQLHLRDLNSLGPVVWHKLISNFLLGSELAPSIDERAIANKGKILLNDDLRRYVVDHYALNPSERLAYIVRYSLAMSKYAAPDFYLNFVIPFMQVSARPFLEGDITLLHNFGVSLAEVETLALEWLEHPDPKVFQCGYELLLQCAKVSPLKYIKLRLKHLAKFCSLAYADTRKAALEDVCALAGPLAEPLRELFLPNTTFSEQLWSKVLLENPLWENEGIELWRERTPPEARPDAVRNIFRSNPRTALKLLSSVNKTSPALANEVANYFLNRIFPKEDPAIDVLVNAADWIFQNLLEGGFYSIALSLFWRYLSILQVNLQTLRNLYEHLSPDQRMCMRPLMRNLNASFEKANWMFAAGAQLKEWIEELVKKEQWDESFTLIQELNNEGMVAEFRGLLYPSLLNWINGILSIRPTVKHLWYISFSLKLIVEFEGHLDRQTRQFYHIMLLNKAMDSLTKTEAIGFVGLVNGLLQKVTDDLLKALEEDQSEHFYASVTVIGRVLNTVIYDHYPILQTTAANLTRLSPYIMRTLHSRKMHGLILELTEAYQKRKSERINMQATPETLEAWIFACRTILRTQSLTLDERLYLQKIVSRVSQFESLYPEGKHNPLYESLEEMLEELFLSKETEIGLALYDVLAARFPENVVRYSGLAVAALEVLVGTGRIAESFERLKSKPIEVSAETIKKNAIVKWLVEYSVSINPPAIPCDELLKLMKQYQIESLKAWLVVLKHYKELKDKKKFEYCWNAFRSYGVDTDNASALIGECWSVGIAGLADLSSELLLEFISELETFYNLLQNGPAKQYWVDTYLNLLRGTLPIFPKDKYNADTIALLFNTLRGLEKDCEASPERMTMYIDSRYRLICLKSSLPSPEDYSEAAVTLLDDLKVPASDERRKAQGQAVHHIVKNLTRFDAFQPFHFIAYKYSKEIIEHVMATPSTYYSPILIIDVLRRIPHDEIVFNAGAFLAHAIVEAEKENRNLNLKKYFTPANLAELINAMLNNKCIQEYIRDTHAHETISNILLHPGVRSIINPADLTAACDKLAMLTVPILMEKEPPKEAYKRISTFILFLSEISPQTLLRDDFFQLILKVLEKFLRNSNFDCFTSLSYNYMKEFLIAVEGPKAICPEGIVGSNEAYYQNGCDIAKPAYPAKVNVTTHVKNSKSVTPYLIRYLEIVKMTFKMFREPSFNLAQKAYICDFSAYALIELITYTFITDVKFHNELEEQLRNFLYLVSPRDGKLFLKHSTALGGVCCNGIVIGGLAKGYYQSRRKLLAEFYFFMNCHLAVRASLFNMKISFSDQESIDGLTVAVKTLFERFPCGETYIYSFALIRTSLDAVEFVSYDFLPDIIRVLGLAINIFPLESLSELAIIQSVLEFPYFAKICKDDPPVKKLPILMAAGKGLIEIIFVLYVRMGSQDMQTLLIRSALNVFENLSTNYISEYSKEYCSILETLKKIIISHLGTCKNLEEECFPRFLKLCQASKLSVPAEVAASRSGLLHSFLRETANLNIQIPEKYRVLFANLPK